MTRNLGMLAVAMLAAATASSEEAAVRRVTFDDAVRLTLARNATARVADDEVARAEALVTEARSSWLPIVSAQAAYTRIEGDRTVAGRLTQGADSFGASISANVPIVAVKGWAQSRRAEDQVTVSRASAVDVRRTLAVATGHAYLAAIAAQRQLDVVDLARRVAQAHVDYARARRAGGLGNEIDLVRAEQELGADEAQEATARLALTRAREALGILVSGEGPLDAAEEPAFESPPPVPEGLDEATTRRADVAAARQRLSAADAARHDDWTDYAPVLGVVGQAFYDAPQIDPIPRWGYQASLVLTVPIYDGGLRNGQARERELNQIEAREDLGATLRQARSEVRAAADEEARAVEALDASRRSANAAQRALDLATTGYKAGALTSLEVTDAERTARDAATAVVIAEDTVRQARLDLLAATGRFPRR
jgi:outer membrane protein